MHNYKIAKNLPIIVFIMETTTTSNWLFFLRWVHGQVFSIVYKLRNNHPNVTKNQLDLEKGMESGWIIKWVGFTKV
jgi:hypothetical protein